MFILPSPSVVLIYFLISTVKLNKISTKAQFLGAAESSKDTANCVYVKKLNQDSVSDWYYSNPLAPDYPDNKSYSALGLNASSENVAQLLMNTFGDAVKNGLFKVTPVREGCDLVYCADDNLLGEKCIWSKNFEKAAISNGVSSDRSVGVKLPDNETLPYVTCSCSPPASEIAFNSSWIGVIYSAYDKHKEYGDCEGKSAVCSPKWDTYTKEEFKGQVDVLASKFRQFSLYGSGTVGGKSWPESKILSSRIPLYLAEMNKDAGFLRMQGLTGVFRLPSKDYSHQLVEEEKVNAINLTIEANKIYPQTIWGVTLQLNLWLDKKDFSLENETELVKVMLKDMRSSLHEYPELRIGLRVLGCEFLVNDESGGVRPEQKDHYYCSKDDIYCPTPELNDPYIEIMALADFIVCVIHPWKPPPITTESYTMTQEVKFVGISFLRTQYALQRVNSKIKLIGESGWPSQGRTRSNSPNNLVNLRNYWIEMSKWSAENKLFVYMFEAFDESWKNNNMPESKDHDSLKCGSEAYWGWWKRKNNSVPAQYIEKCSELPEDLSKLSSSTISVLQNISSECQEKSSSDPEAKTSWFTILVITCLLLLLIFIGVMAYMGRRLRIAQKSEAILSRRYLEMFLNGVQSPGLSTEGDQDHYEVVALRFPYNRNKYELNKSQMEIDTTSLLGKGQSGTVYKGKINRNGNAETTVAFKTTDAFSSILDVKNLLSEIKIMSYIGEHRNIVCLLGACTEKLEKGIVFVALEFCSLGSLDKYLLNLRAYYKSPPLQSATTTTTASANNIVPTDATNSYVSAAFVEDIVMQTRPSSLGSSQDNLDFDFDFLQAWAYEIANGMEFLASKKVVHADLATRNILLTGSKSIKITDFGLSRKLYHEIGETFDPEVPLPWRWMSPQSLRRLTFSTETDVWSYGITLWEIFSLGDVPYSAASFSNQFIVNLENGERLEQPQYASLEIYKIMLNCWNLKPSARPDFTELKREFQSFSTLLVNADEITKAPDEEAVADTFTAELVSSSLSQKNSYINQEALAKKPIVVPSSVFLDSSSPRYVSPCFAQSDYCSQELLS